MLECINKYNYTSRNFEIYNRSVLSNVCKELKISVDKRNCKKVLKKCRNIFNVSCPQNAVNHLHNYSSLGSIEISDCSAKMCSTIQPSPLKPNENKYSCIPITEISLSHHIMKDYSSNEYVTVNDSDLVASETVNSLVSPLVNKGLAINSPSIEDFTLKSKETNHHSTPIKDFCSDNDNVTPFKHYGPIKQFKRTATPIRNAYYNKTPVKSGKVLPTAV